MGSWWLLKRATGAAGVCGFDTERNGYGDWPLDGHGLGIRKGGECIGEGEESISDVSDSILSETSASVGDSSASVDETASTVEKATLWRSGDCAERIDGREGRCGFDAVQSAPLPCGVRRRVKSGLDSSAKGVNGASDVP